MNKELEALDKLVEFTREVDHEHTSSYIETIEQALKRKEILEKIIIKIGYAVTLMSADDEELYELMNQLGGQPNG